MEAPGEALRGTIYLPPSASINLGMYREHVRAATTVRADDGTSMRSGQPAVVPIRALALDVDGTIADTDPIHAEAWARALHAVNGRQFQVCDYLKACINGAMTPQQFISSFSSEAEYVQIETEKRQVYPSLLGGRAVLTAGLVEFLAEAHSAGVGLAIVSSSSRESVDALLEGPWQSQAPDVIVARGDASSPKPDPAPYKAAVEGLEVPAELVAAFEDSEAGALSARTAGLTCIQVGLGPQTVSQFRVADFRDCSVRDAGQGPCLMVWAQ
jgi:putative hydrolase of the HAD superfamily